MALAPGQFTAFHDAVDPLTPRVANALARAIGAERRSITQTELVAMASDPNLVLPADLGDVVGARMRDELVDVYMTAMRIAASELGLDGRVAKALTDAEAAELGVATDGAVVLDFAAPTPNSLAYAEARAANLVTRINGSVREAIRNEVARAVREGGNPRAIAPRLRGVIGLTERQAIARANLERRLVEAGRPPSFVNRELDKYTTRATRTRAETIARTEIMDAMNAGVQDGWQQFSRNGLIIEERVVREWIATADERTCPICAPLDGTTAPLDGSFDGIDRPPAHPRCRCTMALVSPSLVSGSNFPGGEPLGA